MSASAYTKFAGAVAVVLSGPLVLAGKTGVPERSWWNHSSDPAVVVTVVVSAVALLYGLYKAYDELAIERRRQELEQQRLLEKVCRSAMVPIASQLHGVDLNLIGIHLWATDAKATRLKRVIKYTMDLERRETAIEWVKGKGVIGAAWDTGAVIVDDLSELVERARIDSDENFESALPESERYGMTRAEVLKSAKYLSILAVPLGAGEDDPESIIGVVSVDCTAPGHRDALLALATSAAFEDILGTCQNYLRAHS